MHPVDYLSPVPMSDFEADRLMDAHFKQLAKEDAAEKAKFRANAASHAFDSVDADTSADAALSPQMQEVKMRLLASLRPKKRAAIVALASTPVGSEAVASLTTHSGVCDSRAEPKFKVESLPVEPAPGGVIAVATPATDVARFPVGNLKVVTEFEDHLKAMTDLCQQQLTHKNYLRVRDDYCRHSIALNLIGKLAPGWRPKLKAGAAFGKTIHNVIHRDQVVIDLHWCHATNMPLMAQDADHVALFSDSEGFDFELAWELAGKKWKGTYRAAEALCLTTLQQCQTLTLVGPELKARLDDIDSGWRKSEGRTASKMATIKRQISQWAERDKRISPRHADYEKLWLARELLGRDTSKQLIAELHALMVGAPVKDRTTIRDMLKSLNKHITVT
jgi:hypothetical protein